MKKGISLYFGFYLPIEKRVELIKSAGFDCVISNADKKFNDNSKRKFLLQCKLIKKNKLRFSSLHMSYSIKELPYFWKNTKLGHKLEKNLIRDVKIAKKFGFSCVVVHLMGQPNQIGLDRLKRILKVCAKVKIPLAIENIDENDCLFYVFKIINDKYLKFCFDIGHQNIYDKDIDFLELFKDKLIALHLHDNMGVNDDHTLNRYGSINWRNFARKIAKINPNICLDYEILMKFKKDETASQVVNLTFNQALELENMINEEVLKLKQNY